jgi:hypothetical protein
MAARIQVIQTEAGDAGVTESHRASEDLARMPSQLRSLVDELRI